MDTARDVMTAHPVTLDAEASLVDAARAMRDADIGDVLVTRGGAALGIVTDRDLVVRGLAAGVDPVSTRLGDCCSSDLLVVDANDAVDDVVALMREKAIRRVPVTAAGRVVGIISLGDLARAHDPSSPLAEISAAPANG